MTSTPIAYTTEAIVQPVDVTFDANSGVTTLAGATCRADAINLQTGAKVAGSTAITPPARLVCTFTAGSLAVGSWSLQATVTPPAGLPDVVWAQTFIVKAGAAP